MNISLTILLLALLPSISFGLDADAIKGLAKKPHDRSEIMEELKIYPEAREYRIHVVTSSPDHEPSESPPVTVKEKVVDNKYIVSEMTLPGVGEIVMVVTFDRGTKLYRKWVLLPDNNTGEMIGTSAKGSRAISWREVTKPEGTHHDFTLGMETHSPMETRWTEIYFKDGKEIYRNDGTAKVTKQK